MIAALVRSRGGCAPRALRSHFPVPDVPRPRPYHFRRHYSMYEMGMWYPDEAQPEYVVSFSEGYLRNASTALREMGKGFLVFLPFFAFFFAVFALSLSPTYHQGTTMTAFSHPDSYACAQEREDARNPALARDVTGAPLKFIAQVKRDVRDTTLCRAVEQSDAVLRASNAELLAFIARERDKAVARKFGPAPG